MWIAQGWKDYELLDATDGMRLERWGSYVLERPDPQVIWKSGRNHPRWQNPDAVYRRSATGGGAWSKHRLPASWTVTYGDLRFAVRPMSFKHTGLFPEQAVNWDEARRLITRRSQSGGSQPGASQPGASQPGASQPGASQPGAVVKLLNLFAYTGAASAACAKAGAAVTHVDAAKGMVSWAGENAALNAVQARWIVEDCRRFMEREVRRGHRYDAIIMDPPSYGRGPGGEIWRLEDDLFDFLQLSVRLLNDNPLFVFVNAYTTGLAPGVLSYMLDTLVSPVFGGTTLARELGLPVSNSTLILPCGATGRWFQ